jgi:4a-hydroxytetrahydrobiopterin dehydratase
MEMLKDWTLAADQLAISREFIFRSFAEAFGFMTEAALVAEKIDHHPEWSNNWRKVLVKLTTHSAKGLTALDFQLAKAMEEIGKKRLHSP